jgi:hypothetical protein
METFMNTKDERIRNALNDSPMQANVDVRNLAIEVRNSDLIVKGTCLPRRSEHNSKSCFADSAVLVGDFAAPSGGGDP